MAIGIVIEYAAIAALAAFVVYELIQVAKLKGYHEGVQKEAQNWVDAINKVTVPNWQSLPIPPGTTPEQAQIAAKIYVEAYKVALDTIKEEIAMNRINSLLDEMQKMALEAGKLDDVK
jgi:ribonuclease D